MFHRQPGRCYEKRGSTEAFLLFAGLFKLCNGFFIRNKFFHIVKV